jgi:hypothetical protein
LFVVAILAALQACVVSQSRKAEADKIARSVYAECESLLKSGSLKTHAAVFKCAAPRVVAAYQQSGYPFEDLIFVDLVAHRNGAQNIDEQDATEAAVQTELRQLETRLTAEEARRLNIIKFGGSPKAEPADELLDGLTALKPTPDAAASTPRPSQKTPGCFLPGSPNRCQ